MSGLKESAVIVALCQRLREEGSWGGETHLQKTTYFLKSFFDVPLSAEFTLYKHGPFSFDFKEKLAWMRASNLLTLVPQPYPYGPSYDVTPAGTEVMKKFPKTLKRIRPFIDFVASDLGHFGVGSLEKLSTALYIEQTWPELDAAEKVRMMQKLKPHVPESEANWAFQQLRGIKRKAQQLAPS
jgi:hypothetical protein